MLVRFKHVPCESKAGERDGQKQRERECACHGFNDCHISGVAVGIAAVCSRFE